MLYTTLESPRTDVSAGRKRLQIAATCAKSTTGASGMGYGESPRLTAMLNSIITASEVGSTR